VVVSVGAIGKDGANFAGVTPTSKFVNLPLMGSAAPQAAVAYRIFDQTDDYGAAWKTKNANSSPTSAVTASFIP